MFSMMEYYDECLYFFFFQAEDGIRDLTVTGVQTCALPICRQEAEPRHGAAEQLVVHRSEHVVDAAPEDPEEPGGEEDRNREEEARDEADLEPVLHAGRHDRVEDNTTPPSRAHHRRWTPGGAGGHARAGARPA